MPYGKGPIKKGKDDKKKPDWATIMPVKPGKPGKTKPGRKTIQPVKPGLKRGM